MTRRSPTGSGRFIVEYVGDKAGGTRLECSVSGSRRRASMTNTVFG